MKVALLIGVSESGYGLPQLPTAVNDIEVMRQVLARSDRGGFDEVNTLLNPNPPVMREAIQRLFSERTENDLVLLFFSGYGVKDDTNQLYFATGITATRITSKNLKGELVKATVLPASFVRESLSNSPCQKQVVILNWYFSTAFHHGITPKDEDTTDIKTQLGGEGWVLLTSCTSRPHSLEQQNSQVSPYTRYLVEGIQTGAAERDGDGWISIEELHEYVSRKLKESAPAWQPDLYCINKRLKILLTEVQLNDPKLKYWKEAERWANYGEISSAARHTLDRLGRSLHLLSEDCMAIEAEVLKPYQEYQEKLQHYAQAFTTAMQRSYPFSHKERDELRILQQSLGLRNEDLVPIEERFTFPLTSQSLSQEPANQPTTVNPADEQEIALISELAVEPFSSDLSFPDETNQLTESAISSDSSNEETEDENEIAIAPPTAIPPTPNSRSENNTDQQTPLPSESKQNLASSTPQTVPSWYMQTPSLPPTDLTSVIHSSSNRSGSKTSTTPSTSRNKRLLFMGIGGGIVAVGLLIGLATRTSVVPPTNSTNTLSPSPDPSPIVSPKTVDAKKSSNPSNPTSKEPKTCSAIVKGNIRSEPASFRDNVINFSQEELIVTGKQTQGGWVQVKRSDGTLAWAHRDVIENETEMDRCLLNNQIEIQIVEDIIPPIPQDQE